VKTALARLTVLAAAALLLPGSAGAQGTIEDYRRSASISQKYAGLVTGVADAPNCATPGARVVLELPSANPNRSRSSRGQRRTLDEGRTTLGEFVAYTLRARSPNVIEVAVRNRIVLDETPHSGTRRVTFAAQPPTLTVDDISAPLLPGPR